MKWKILQRLHFLIRQNNTLISYALIARTGCASYLSNGHVIFHISIIL